MFRLRRLNLTLMGLIITAALLLLATRAGLAQDKGDINADPKLAQVTVINSTSAPDVAPPVPPICTTSGAANFLNSTPVAITDNSTATSTIDVSGMGTYAWDIDLNVAIVHTFAADLEITLTSPAGTVVTITTDNGGGNDDVFNGTLFDDDADDPVTDHTYANAVVATPLVPEGALAAFIGEDPNGTWTLDIFDDAGGDSGSLNSWSLDITSLDAAPSANATASMTNSTPVAITDNTTATSTIDIAGAFAYMSDVNLSTSIVHTFAADLEITLTSPAGTVVTISTDNGGGNDDVFNGTLFDDSAADTVTDFIYTNGVTATPLVPEEAMGAFIGEDPNGTWTLEIFDDAGGDVGSLNSWTLDIAGVNCAPTDVALTSLSGSNGNALPLAAGILLVALAGLFFVYRRRLD